MSCFEWDWFSSKHEISLYLYLLCRFQGHCWMCVNKSTSSADVCLGPGTFSMTQMSITSRDSKSCSHSRNYLLLQRGFDLITLKYNARPLVDLNGPMSADISHVWEPRVLSHKVLIMRRMLSLSAGITRCSVWKYRVRNE